jgi:hypothetical protein
MTELDQAQHCLMVQLEGLLTTMELGLSHMLGRVSEIRKAQKRVYEAQYAETCAANAALEERLNNG